MKIIPLFDRLVISPSDCERTSTGGLILTKVSDDQPKLGIVVALPINIESKKTELLIDENLKVGDHVLYDKYAGAEYTEKNTKFIILRQADLLAVIKD